MTMSTEWFMTRDSAQILNAYKNNVSGTMNVRSSESVVKYVYLDEIIITSSLHPGAKKLSKISIT